MRRVWGVLLCLSVSAALGFGRWDEAAAAVLAAGNQALSLGMTLIGGMMIWGGLMAILQESGAMGPVSRWMRKLLQPLVRRDLSEESWAAMGMNLAANLLGLGNAATPLGIQAARRMSRDCSGVASDELCLLVVLNTASIQLLPATIASVRAAAGSAAPLDILPAVWLSSALSVAAGLTAARLFSALGRWRR